MLKIFITLLGLLALATAYAGETEQAIDKQINARVYSVLDSLGLLGATPPPTEPPPVEPPPTGSCAPGFIALGGWWQGWCGDQGQNFTTSPDGSYGIMAGNADASRLLGDGVPWPSGWCSWEWQVALDQMPYNIPGTHLGGVRSNAQHKFAYDQWVPCMLRPDMSWRKNADGSYQIVVHTYMHTAAGGKVCSDWVCDSWFTGLRLGPVRTWNVFRFEWARRSPTSIWFKLTLNGRSAERTLNNLDPCARDMSSLMFGNIDIGSNVRAMYFRAFKAGH